MIFLTPHGKLVEEIPLRETPSEIFQKFPVNPLRNFEKMFKPLEIERTIFDPFGNFPQQVVPLQKCSFYDTLQKFQLGIPSEIQNFRPPWKISSTGGCRY
jgi:hypothetical protein